MLSWMKMRWMDSVYSCLMQHQPFLLCHWGQPRPFFCFSCTWWRIHSSRWGSTTPVAQINHLWLKDKCSIVCLCFSTRLGFFFFYIFFLCRIFPWLLLSRLLSQPAFSRLIDTEPLDEFNGFCAAQRKAEGFFAVCLVLGEIGFLWLCFLNLFHLMFFCTVLKLIGVLQRQLFSD